MATAVVFTIIFGLGIYLFMCFVQFKICEKFGIGSLFECCIPIYNMVLLCRCADISGWNVLWLILPGALFRGDLSAFALIITIIFTVILWGKIAEKMGRSFWQYGLGCTFLLGIPILVLAFGSAHPAQAGNPHLVQQPDRYVTPEPIYKPLPANDPFKAPSPVVSSSINILCINGEYKGNSIPVSSEGLTIGRDPARCQIVLSSNDASRAHTSVTPNRNDPRSVIVTDLQSTNGTFRQTSGSTPQSYKWERIVSSIVLTQGSRFRIGKDVAEFEVR
jgi:hypothetical protein